jgi:hypothetical protein
MTKYVNLKTGEPTTRNGENAVLKHTYDLLHLNWEELNKDYNNPEKIEETIKWDIN